MTSILNNIDTSDLPAFIGDRIEGFQAQRLADTGIQLDLLRICISGPLTSRYTISVVFQVDGVSVGSLMQIIVMSARQVARVVVNHQAEPEIPCPDIMKNGLWIADVKLALYVFWECLPLRQKTTPELWWFFCDENFLGGRGALHVDGLLEIGVVTNYMS